MPLSKQELTSALVDAGFLTADQLKEAMKEADTRHVPIEQVLVDRGLMADDNIGRLFADAYGVRFVDLRKTEIDPAAVSAIPEIVAQKHNVVSYGWKDGKRLVAIVDPRDLDIIGLLEKKFGEDLDVAYTTPSSLSDGLATYSADVRKEVVTLAEQFSSQKNRLALVPKAGAEDLLVRLVQLLLQYGYDNNASDMHIEPHEHECLVRFRIDGVLHDVFHLPKDMHDLIVARIKILSNLRTDEHFAAQDGKFRAQFGSDKADVRVSVIPIVEGEKVVLRILSEKGRTFTLESLGLDGKDLAKVQTAANKPYGMILATGPTGSGKTTTMYAVLKILNQRDVNIATIEDPVEYDIDGVNQIQVNERANLNFATGLRSIVRQDPDIIMVGEIRDDETADISVNAAMTGHLVLSTLHTNDAATALPRLLDMGVEPFLIASSVNVIIAQRLVRHICKSCIASQQIDMAKFGDAIPADLKAKYLGKKGKTTAFAGKGCAVCHGSGFQGRVGIFEVLEVTDKIRNLIVTHADASVLAKEAIAEGMTTMLEDGLKKVMSGVTTLEELLRVVK